MESFNERKNNYFKKLRENCDALEKMIQDNSDNEESQDLLEIILDPQDEIELRFAEAVFDIESDILSLVERASYGEVKKIPVEENEGVKLFIDLVSALKEKRSDDFIARSTRDTSAKEMYGFLVGSILDIEGSMEYIASSTGFDLKDDLDLVRFNFYFNKSQIAFNKNNRTGFDYAMLDGVGLETLSNFSEEFHQLCEDGKRENGLVRTKVNGVTIKFL